MYMYRAYILFSLNIEYRHWKSNIILRSSSNGETADKIHYPEQYKTLRGKDCEVEKIMKFLKEMRYLKKYKHIE